MGPAPMRGRTRRKRIWLGPWRQSLTDGRFWHRDEDDRGEAWRTVINVNAVPSHVKFMERPLRAEPRSTR